MMKIILPLLFCVLTWYRAGANTVAVIEKEETHFSVSSTTKMTCTETVRIKILSKEGDDFSEFATYYDAFSKVRSVSYKILNADGKVIKRYSKLDASDMLLNPSYETSDGHIISIDPDYGVYPYWVETEVVTDYTGFIGFPAWMPRYAPDLEVKEAHLDFDFPIGYKYRSRVLNGISDPVITNDDKRVYLSWTVRDLPSVSGEMGRKLFLQMQPIVYLTPVNFNLDGHDGSFETWKDFGDWFLALNENKDLVSPKSRAFIDGLKADSLDNRTLINQIYHYMQGNTRYISIQLGIGGYQAMTADEVEKTGYGDCKALTNYLKILLSYAGIPSNYVLAMAGENVRDVMADFPSNQFNHVFLAVPLEGDTVLFECTSQLVPMDYIGTFTDDRNVLWVQQGESKIWRTPAYSADKNIRLRTSVVSLDDKGNAQIALKSNMVGAYFDEMMAYKSMPSDRVERFNYKKFNYKNFAIKSFDYEIPDKDKPEMNLYFDIQTPGLGQVIADKLILPTDVLASVEEDVLVDAFNKVGEVRRAFTTEDHVEVKVPEKFHFGQLPPAKSLDTPYGKMNIEVTQKSEHSIEITRKVVVYKGLYTDQDFSKFYDYLKQVRSAGQSKLVFQSKT